jgi:hypothetical protein
MIQEQYITRNTTYHKMDPLIKKEFDEVKAMIKELKKELRGLIEIQQRLIHERLGVAVPPPPKEYGEETTSKSNKIEITDFSEGRIKVSGNTFDYKTAIKEAGQAKWENSSKSWSLPSSSLDALVKNLEGLNLVSGKDFVVNVTTVVNDEEEAPDEGFGSGL